ncbi:MAG: RNA polymerase sigma factor [Planctomycetes bacterium]|nr:RNA polymerase sigma factor [Planctomycetota bacterium]
MNHKPVADADVDLLALYRDGDRQAFRRLVDLYRERMLQFFYRLCWDRDRAEDLVQDLFLKLLLGSRRYRPEGKLSTFVYRVATNLWIDHYRQQRPRPRFHSLDQVLLDRDGDELPAREHAAAGKTPMEQAVDGEEKAALRRAIENLTEPHRIVFELAVYQQLPYQEIGDLLGIPVGTVKSRMHNTVQALKQVLAAATPAAAEGKAGPRRGLGGAG